MACGCQGSRGRTLVRVEHPGWKSGKLMNIGQPLSTTRDFSNSHKFCVEFLLVFSIYFTMATKSGFFPRFFWGFHGPWPTRGACRSCSTLEAEDGMDVGCGWHCLGHGWDLKRMRLLMDYYINPAWVDTVSLDISWYQWAILIDSNDTGMIGHQVTQISGNGSIASSPSWDA